MEPPTVVIDNGTGYTKLGLSGNMQPHFIIPTTIATRPINTSVTTSRPQADDLDFFIGDEAFNHVRTHGLVYPMKEGQVNSWDDMERYWQRCIHDVMRVEPHNHHFLLTEPPMNTPENREQMAEIMFETFNVKGLYIGVQASMALFASGVTNRQDGTTGLVIDSGDGVTHLIPIAHGFVINSCIKHIPICGRDITKYVMHKLKQRNEQIPPEDLMDTARRVKETFCHVSDNPEAAAKSFANPRSEAWKTFSGMGKLTGTPINIRVGDEQYLGPEAFFNPKKLVKNWDKPLDEMVDTTIQTCPIDVRRGLYNHIVLSGGSTLFSGFAQRLQSLVQQRVNARLARYASESGVVAKPIACQIKSADYQRYAVWLGASMLASGDGFAKSVHTREEYQEHGPSIARSNVVFGLGM